MKPLVQSLAALLLGALLTASPVSAAWRNYTAIDGLPHSSVHAVVEDHEERLWFATLGGASRFDGVEWRNFTVPDGRASQQLECAFVDRDDRVWFGTINSGVIRMDGDSVRTFSSADGLADDHVNWITQDRTGTMWFATDAKGASSFDGVSWVTIPASPGGLPSNGVYCILEDFRGDLWFATSNGVGRRRGATWTRFNSSNGLASNQVRHIFEDRQRNLWFATDRGVSRRDTLGVWHTFTADSGLAGNDVQTVMQDRRGLMWFGTRLQGLSRFDGRFWKTYHTMDGLYVWAMTLDRSGNLWVSNSGGGTRYDGVELESLPEIPALAQAVVFLTIEDPDGALWFTTNNSGAWRWDGRTATNYMAGQPASTMVRDHAGNYWFSQYGIGVTRWNTQPGVPDADRWTTFTVADGLPGAGVRYLMEDSAHRIWITAVDGVAYFDGATWHKYTSADHPALTEMMTALEDASGQYWFSSRTTGLLRFDGGSSWTNFRAEDGLGGNFVWDEYQDLDGNLWFGVRGAGVARLDPTQTWRLYTTSDGLTNNFPLTIDRDRAGNFWFGMDLGGGVVRWDGTNWRSLGLEDGLSSSSVVTVTEDRAGSLWIAAYRGVNRYWPDLVAPRTVIYRRPPAVSASRRQNAQFSALGEVARIEFSYRLDAGAWSAWSDLAAWSADDLADGPHTLEVRSRDYWVNVDSTSEFATFEIDATPPVPVLATPAFGSPVRGVTEIRGTTADTRFLRYELRVRRAGAPTWNDPDASLLASSATPVSAGALASWDTRTLADGGYELRLTVTDSLGLVGAVQTSVVVDNVAPYFDQTTPARISAAEGGDVFTTGAEIHLYVPPHAFAQDAVVTVAPVAPAPAALATATGPLGTVYAIEWNGSALTKPATLEWSLGGTGAGASGGVPALYRSPDGTSWTRLGGTVEAGRLALPITEPGRYALFTDSGDEGGGGGLSALSFTPRVFSPVGTFATSDLAIHFTLGRPGSATVRVYNRAGRLVREVTNGRAFAAGANLVRWDGRDREGRVVPDGPYVVTVEALGSTQRAPLAVVR